jgi:hypothetical protein
MKQVKSWQLVSQSVQSEQSLNQSFKSRKLLYEQLSFINRRCRTSTPTQNRCRAAGFETRGSETGRTPPSAEVKALTACSLRERKARRPLGVQFCSTKAQQSNRGTIPRGARRPLEAPFCSKKADQSSRGTVPRGAHWPLEAQFCSKKADQS